MMFEKSRLVTRFGRFNLVGLLGAGVQISIVSLLSRYLGPAAATCVAVEIAVVHNFLWHERLTWKDRKCAGASELSRRAWRFQLANGLFSILGNSILVSWLVNDFKFQVAQASLISICVCSLANFFLADRWVWRGRKSNGNIGRTSLPKVTVS
jgi:dolichol-phosphate mannosyltransferase